MSKKYIQESWDVFEKMVVPNNASELQIHDTKQAFFGGAAILFTLIMTSLDDGVEATDDDMKKLSDINEEIDGFGQQLDRDVLKFVQH